MPTFESLEGRTLLSANLLANGDFSRGAIQFSTSLGRGGKSLINAGTYVVGTNPQSYHPGGASFGDHTTGTGKMLMVNGSIFANITIWRETINTRPGVEYSFSGWAASWATDGPDEGDISPAEPQITVNGKVIESTTLPSTAGQWTALSGTWVATSGRATIILTDLNTSSAGNDSAYDDFSATTLASVHGTVLSETETIVHGKIRYHTKALANATVFLDTNCDGVLDDGEATAVTTKTGAFSFIGLQAGTYSICEVVPDGSPVTVEPVVVSVAAGAQLNRKTLLDVPISVPET